VTSSEVVRKLAQLGCTKIRQVGSHARYVSACGKCATTVAIHAGTDIKPKTLRTIEKEMEPCLGKNWLRNR
jgi:predicted RNA binding protein YcfA (HicA-like mRNA interferase family)